MKKKQIKISIFVWLQFYFVSIPKGFFIVIIIFLVQVAIRDYHLWECHYMKRLQSNFRHYTMALRMVLCNWNQFLKRFIWGEF